MENAKHDPSKHEATKYEPTKYEPPKEKAVKPHDAVKADEAAAEPEEKEPTQAEKDGIIREAVSWYLRNDFRDKTIRKVCEEFIAGVDKAARGAAETTTQKK